MPRDFGGGKLHRVSATLLNLCQHPSPNKTFVCTRQATVTWHTNRRDVSWGKRQSTGSTSYEMRMLTNVPRSPFPTCEYNPRVTGAGPPAHPVET